MFEQSRYTSVFENLYGPDTRIIARHLKRYGQLDRTFAKTFGKREVYYFSTPGRTEISGNHTDHNHGRVIAASVNLDSIAAAAPNGENRVRVYSEGYSKPFVVKLTDLSVHNTDKGTTRALIRGIAARLRERGYLIGGFDAFMTSDVLPGSGLSSSASIEVLIGTIFNAFFNQNRIPPEEIARIGQYAENHYFGKPCGLMDQMACAVGGIITIDFKDPDRPALRKIPFDLENQGYSLVLVNTGGTHADLTGDYAAVPAEMKSVAAVLGKNTLRDVSENDFLHRLPEIRKVSGDRAILRAFHFLQENERVSKQVAALEDGRFDKFLHMVSDSGTSSYKWLQNIYNNQNTREQSVALALALTDKFIVQNGAGACRIHGGGFAGTILVFLPKDQVKKYSALIKPVFGPKSILTLNIRQTGTCALEKQI